MQCTMNLFFISLSIIYFIPVISNATICVPFSHFKIDCNLCKCSENGREYACTTKTCIAVHDGHYYDNEQDGYILFKPKNPKAILEIDSPHETPLRNFITNEEETQNNVDYSMFDIANSESDGNHAHTVEEFPNTDDDVFDMLFRANVKKRIV